MPRRTTCVGSRVSQRAGTPSSSEERPRSRESETHRGKPQPVRSHRTPPQRPEEHRVSAQPVAKATAGKPTAEFPPASSHPYPVDSSFESRIPTPHPWSQKSTPTKSVPQSPSVRSALPAVQRPKTALRGAAKPHRQAGTAGPFLRRPSRYRGYAGRCQQAGGGLRDRGSRGLTPKGEHRRPSGSAQLSKERHGSPTQRTRHPVG
jgi:hypothetical protein